MCLFEKRRCWKIRQPLETPPPRRRSTDSNRSSLERFKNRRSHQRRRSRERGVTSGITTTISGSRVRWELWENTRGRRIYHCGKRVGLDRCRSRNRRSSARRSGNYDASFHRNTSRNGSFSHHLLSPCSPLFFLAPFVAQVVVETAVLGVVSQSQASRQWSGR